MLGGEEYDENKILKEDKAALRDSTEHLREDEDDFTSFEMAVINKKN